MREAHWRAVRQVALAAVAATAFYLFAAALFAVIIKAYAPAEGVIAAGNWGLKCVGAFVSSLIFVRAERALFKGMAAGISACLLSLLLFAAIGGFHLTPLFAAELAVMALCGGGGALLGVKLRKEE